MAGDERIFNTRLQIPNTLLVEPALLVRVYKCCCICFGLVFNQEQHVMIFNASCQTAAIGTLGAVDGDLKSGVVEDGKTEL